MLCVSSKWLLQLELLLTWRSRAEMKLTNKTIQNRFCLLVVYIQRPINGWSQLREKQWERTQFYVRKTASLSVGYWFMQCITPWTYCTLFSEHFFALTLRLLITPLCTFAIACRFINIINSWQILTSDFWCCFHYSIKLLPVIGCLLLLPVILLFWVRLLMCSFYFIMFLFS